MIRYKENGIEIEFESVKDLIEFRKGVQQKKKQKEIVEEKKIEKKEEKPVKRIRRKKGTIKIGGRVLTTQQATFELEQLIADGKSFSQSVEELYGYSPTSEQRKRMKKLLNNVQTKVPAKELEDSISMVRPSQYMKRKKSWMDFRGKYVNSIMKKYNCNLPEAVRILGMTWKESGKDYKVAQKKVEGEEEIFVKTFPNLPPVESEFDGLLQKIIKAMINEPRDYFFRRHMEALVVGIDTPEGWVEFKENFMAKSSLIASYFGVPNKFRTEGKNVIKYGG